MRGKHGRYRPGQPDDGELTADLITEPGHGGDAASASPASASAASGSTSAAVPTARGALWVPGGTTFHPPSARLAPTPPSLPPIRTEPLPEYVAGAQEVAPAPSTDSADDDHAGVDHDIVHDIVQSTTSTTTSTIDTDGVIDAVVVEQSRADLLAAAAAVRLAAHFPASVAASVPATDEPLSSLAAVSAPVTQAPVQRRRAGDPRARDPSAREQAGRSASARPAVARHAATHRQAVWVRRDRHRAPTRRPDSSVQAIVCSRFGQRRQTSPCALAHRRNRCASRRGPRRFSHAIEQEGCRRHAANTECLGSHADDDAHPAQRKLRRRNRQCLGRA